MRSLLFVYRFRRDRLPPRALGELGAWEGTGHSAYEGVTLTFFENGHRARLAAKSLLWLYGGKRVGNVIVAWDQGFVPRQSVRATVVGCLRTGPAVVSKRAAPHATLATFAGRWGGHTRGLRISPDGRGLESTDAGCCVRVYRMTFQVLGVTGTLTRAAATFRVTSFTRFAAGVPRLRVGQIGKLLLRDGIVTNALTGMYFCSAPAWGATLACGA